MKTDEAIDTLMRIDHTQDKGLYNAIATAITALREQQKQPNDPLTLEELLTMNTGEIIYCSPLNDWAKVTQWGIVFFGAENCRTWPEIKNDYGKTWRAYRRKPEQEELQ